MMTLQMAMDLPDDPRSVPMCRRALGSVLRELGIDEMRAYEVEIVLGEAAANVIRHAYGGPGHRFRVELHADPERLRLVVVDGGRGFDRTAVERPADADVNGRGIMIIEQLADRASIELPATGGTRITAEFRLRPRCERPTTSDEVTRTAHVSGVSGGSSYPTTLAAASPGQPLAGNTPASITCPPKG